MAADKKPNVLLIVTDAAGWFGMGTCHRGMKGGRHQHRSPMQTPGLANAIALSIIGCLAFFAVLRVG
jgi:hypothetical protein